MALKPVLRKSLVDDVFEQLSAEIVGGRLAAGTALPSERELCRLLYQFAGPAAACESLEHFAAKHPDDASALHNLGTAYDRVGRDQDAVSIYQRALALRPRSHETRRQLECLLSREKGVVV